MPEENKSQLACLQASSMRDLVNKVNSLGIKKDDIVQLVPHDDALFLLYYK